MAHHMISNALNYIRNILIALDQLGTTLCGGYPDETLSSYAWRLSVQRKPFGFMRGVIDAMFFWQNDHCYHAYREEADRRQLPPHFRNK